jgi:superfamily II DNA/RNA helicase
MLVLLKGRDRIVATQRGRRSQDDVQYVLFSATFPDQVRNFAARFAPNANEIRLKQEELSLEGIKQFTMGWWVSFSKDEKY